MASFKNVGKLNMAMAGEVEFTAADDIVSVFDKDKYFLLPGFCDVHVHFREPGFLYKETIKTGCASAARGGFTAVCTMPNLKPVPDSAENLKLQCHLILRPDSVNRDAGFLKAPQKPCRICTDRLQANHSHH